MSKPIKPSFPLAKRLHERGLVALNSDVIIELVDQLESTTFQLMLYTKRGDTATRNIITASQRVLARIKRQTG